MWANYQCVLGWREILWPSCVWSWYGSNRSWLFQFVSCSGPRFLLAFLLVTFITHIHFHPCDFIHFIHSDYSNFEVTLLWKLQRSSEKTNFDLWSIFASFSAAMLQWLLPLMSRRMDRWIRFFIFLFSACYHDGSKKVDYYHCQLQRNWVFLYI